jgi:hypothetical protein
MQIMDYLTEFKAVLSAATQWGMKSVPFSRKRADSPFENEKHRRKFMSACHRGYEKAQNRIIKVISAIKDDTKLTKAEKTYWELCFRRIVDAMAYTMIRTETHVARRLVLHFYPPAVDLDVILATKKHADELNAQSRLTFALLADLSTFIHVCDIFRVDLRPGARNLSFIEIKSGRINEILIDQLASYEPKEESLNLLETDASIDERHKAQAKRILKQRIRIEQVMEVLEKDSGIDIATKEPIKLDGPTLETHDYDLLLDDLCNSAQERGVSSATVQHCIHIGVGHSDKTDQAIEMAKSAALFAAHETLKKGSDKLHDIRSNLSGIIEEKDFLKGWDPFRWNLSAMSGNPFPLWSIDRKHISALVEGKLRIFSILDLPGFVYLAEELGLSMKLSSKKEAGKHIHKLGRRSFPTWGNRVLIAETPKTKITIGGGMIHRFIVDLKTPAQFILQWAKGAS